VEISTRLNGRRGTISLVRTSASISALRERSRSCNLKQHSYFQPHTITILINLGLIQFELGASYRQE